MIADKFHQNNFQPLQIFIGPEMEHSRNMSGSEGQLNRLYLYKSFQFDSYSSEIGQFHFSKWIHC